MDARTEMISVENEVALDGGCLRGERERAKRKRVREISFPLQGAGKT